MLVALLALGLFPPLCAGVAWLRVLAAPDARSRSIGGVARGRLDAGRPLRPWGKGYVTYSLLGAALGRQYVDAPVRECLEAAFAARAAAEPGRTFIIGETGAAHGGRFWPHRTHQNGRSVDLFVPVVDEAGKPTTLGTWPWNGFGYGIDFDAKGTRGAQHIDFDSAAALLLELEAQAGARGLHIEKIIFAPELIPFLEATPSGRRFGAISQKLMRTPAWVRHDEHIHVDFGA